MAATRPDVNAVTGQAQHGLFGTIQSATPIDGVAAAPPSPAALKVTFSTGEAATLIPAAPPYARFLVEQFQGGTRPLYATTEQGAITTLRVPLIGRVVNYHELPDGSAEAGLDASPLALVLDAGDVVLRELLRKANGSDNVVIVAPDSYGRVLAAAVAPAVAPQAPQFGPGGAEELPALAVATLPEAQLPAIFACMAGLACTPALPDDCFPFDYPNQGCESRAHEMCRMLDAEGHTLGKVWIFNFPATTTPNYPGCHIKWHWHVAPFLRVEGEADPIASVRVLDPSLHTQGFVTLEAFLAGLGRTTADIKFSAARYFQLGFDGRGSLENLDQAIQYLAIYRAKARSRDPQPPYPCVGANA